MNHWTVDKLSYTTTLHCTASTRSHQFKLVEISVQHLVEGAIITLRLSLSAANQFPLINDGEGLTIDGERIACTVLDLSFKGLTIRIDSVVAYQQCSRYVAFSVSVPVVERSIVGEQCRSCRNFHGKHYGVDSLVCAVHPFGQIDCKDWEAKIDNVA